MEKKPSAPRKTFQPSRTRLVQPSELFKPRPAHPPDPAALPDDSAQPAQPPQPSQPTQSDQQNPPASRIPRISSAQNPSRFTPFVSNAPIKPPSFPLRSAKQPVVQAPKQQHLPVLLSKNQPSLQSAKRSAPSSPPKQQLTISAQPVVLSSAQPRSSESKNSHQDAAPLHSPPNGSMHHQTNVPYPLSTLPSNVLRAMPQDKRDGFIAGWNACLKAFPHCNQCNIRNAKTDPSALTRSPALSDFVSPVQNTSSNTQEQCPAPPQSPPARHVLAVMPRKVPPSSGTTLTTTRRSLPDPYAMEQPGKNRSTVGSNKRPRTSSPANSNTHPSHTTPKPTASQPGPSSKQILNSRSTTTPIAQSAPSAHVQDGNSDLRKRTSGLDAYRARAKLPDMQSAKAAFAAASTTEPVEYQRKKRRRNSDITIPEQRAPVETRPRQENRQQTGTRTSQETIRPVDSRNLQQTRRPVDPRNRQETMRPADTRSRQQTRRPADSRNRQETTRSADTRSRQQTRQPADPRNRQENTRPVEARSRHEPRRPVEIRPRPQPVHGTSTIAATPSANAPSWLMKNARTSGNGQVKIPAAASNVDPRQNPGASVGKESMPTSAKRIQPTTANTGAPVRQNGVATGKQILPQPTLESGSRCDLDMVRSSQESQEESGWGSALNAATTREQLPTCSTNGTNSGKQGGTPATIRARNTMPSTNGTGPGKQRDVPANAAEKPSTPAAPVQRDPRLRQQTQCNREAEAKNAANRLAEKEREKKREKERDEITVQAYAERFGLVIVERDRESGKVEWVACKFCPVFGCRTRDPDYIMAHRAPFCSKKFMTHLEKDHCVKWKDYKQANAEEKAKFFSGKVLPAKAFHDRVAELKRSQDGMARRRVTPGVTAEQENKQIEKAMAKLAKHRNVQKVTTLILNSRDDCRIGRERFVDRSSSRNFSVSQRQTPSRTTDPLPPLEKIRKCIKELEIKSEIAGFILHGVVKDSTDEEWDDNDRGFTDTIILEGEEMRPTTLIFSSVDEVTTSRIALTLRYLHDGITSSIYAALLRDMPENQINGPTAVDGSREVFRHANALMALGMYILTRALAADWRSWAAGLTTRPCRYVRGGAVEVLISVYDDGGQLRKAHLITVQVVGEAGAAVMEVLDVVLPSWKQRLLGVHSGICKRTQSHEKQIEAAILEDLRKMTGRDLALVEHNVKRDEKPIFPWALSEMSELKFNALMSNIEGPLGLALGKSRLRAARAQRSELFKRVMSDGAEGDVFREAWSIVGERAEEIRIVAEGLRSIWLCNCEDDGEPVTGGQRRGLAVVDCDAERVLWAQELVRLWKWCGNTVKELGMEPP